ncbi:glutamate-cysteine ligase family protein, partial [Escherichia coli]|uniref:glutamate-cysteine ligase family protein n=1 Tax=Escherichia coli TaxID=562 RepID=UPI0020232746
MPLPDFHVSEPFTLGIELEMQVVNPPGYDLSQDSSMLIDAVKNKITAGEVKHDITESMLELATDVCRDINQAAGQFSAMQKVVLQAATDHHLEICGGGTHPFQKWQRQEVCDNERYQRTLENFGYLIQQATVFGQHVHVGCASGDDAIYLLGKIYMAFGHPDYVKSYWESHQHEIQPLTRNTITELPAMFDELA